jgi:hypothetical protein
MQGLNHLSLHGWRHPGVTRSCWERKGCAWHDIQFGHGQNTRMGWSDPTFAHGSVAKLMLGVAPAQQEFLSVRAIRIWTKQVKKVGITYFSFVFTIFFSL